MHKMMMWWMQSLPRLKTINNLFCCINFGKEHVFEKCIFNEKRILRGAFFYGAGVMTVTITMTMTMTMAMVMTMPMAMVMCGETSYTITICHHYGYLVLVRWIRQNRQVDKAD